MGHSDQWLAFGLEAIDIVQSLLPTVADNGKMAFSRSFGQMPEPYSSVYSQVYPDGPVQTMLIRATHREKQEALVKAWFPYFSEGYEHEIEVLEAREGSSPFEGVIGARMGRSCLAFFAPLWTFERWPWQGEATVRLAALAYSLEPAIATTPPPSQQALFKGKRAFFPATSDRPEDAYYQSVIESIEELWFLDIPLWRMEIGLFVDCSHQEESIPRIPLYAAKSICQPGYKPKVGDIIQGVCWLQACLATSTPMR